MKVKLTALVLLLCSTTVRADVSADFEDGTLQGWTKSTELSQFAGNLYITHAGSHPYCLHAVDTCAGCGTLIVAAPPQFRGDLSACTAITWEEYIPDADRADTELNTSVILVGVNGTQFDSIKPARGPLHTWISRSAPLQASAWQRNRGTNSFAEVLQNVQHLLVVIEIGSNNISLDEAYLDNIRLIGNPACSSSVIPAIISQPANQRFCLPGETATFHVAASGAQPIRYQWQFSFNYAWQPEYDWLPPSWVWWSDPVILPGQTNAQLTVTNVHWTNSGFYRVVVFNNCGSVTSEEATLAFGPPLASRPQPSWLRRCPGDSATFSATIEGFGPFGYQWQFNGTNLLGKCGSDLTLTDVQTNDAGAYRVIVTNACGWVTSPVATLSIGSPLLTDFGRLLPNGYQWESPNQGTVVWWDQAVTLGAKAAGSAPLQYQWQFNSTNLPGQTGTSLDLSPVQPSNAGNYRVIVTNGCGSVTSSVFTLTVLTCPIILTQPTDRGAFSGQHVSFWVTATAGWPLQCQWQFNGTNLPSRTNSLLTLPSVQTNDAGLYRAVITAAGRCSVTSAVASLAVANPMEFTCYTNQMGVGANLIAHQVDYGGNTLDEIMPVVPEGTELLKFNLASNAWEVAQFLNDAWHDVTSASRPERLTFQPGEGAFLITTQAFTLTFCGAVRQPVLPLNLPAFDYFLCSGQVPFPSTYEDIVGHSPADGDLVFRWDVTLQDFSPVIYSYYLPPGVWDPVTPVIPVGEAVYIFSTSGSGLPIPMDFPPRILQHPVAQAVNCGGAATFSVVAGAYFGSASSTTNYQWYLNDAPIPGAVSRSLVITNASTTAQGFYHVLVSNESGVARSLPAALSIADATAPTISACATNLTLPADVSCQATLPDLTGQVIASDNCGNVRILQNPVPGTGLSLGTNSVTLTATDDFGNSNNCSVNVVVVDVTPPVLVCPSNVTSTCENTNGARVVFAPSALDNCDPAPVITCIPPSGSCFPVGTNLVSCTARDAGGNTNTSSFTVTVVDPILPALRITQQNSNASIFWPQTCTSFVLEENGSLTATNWLTSTAAVVVVGNEYSATVTAGTGERFFRLRRLTP